MKSKLKHGREEISVSKRNKKTRKNNVDMEWDQIFASNFKRKCILDQIIMDYFVVEGYQDAAKKMWQESGVKPDISLSDISDRKNILQHVREGNIIQAIQLTNKMNPNILDGNKKLNFLLKKQQLIELVRESFEDSNKLDEVLSFAQQEIAPIGMENNELLPEVEEVMTLLAFTNPEGSSLGHLLGDEQRLQTARALNTAILSIQSQHEEPQLINLIKMMKWSESKLEELGEKVDKVADIASGRKQSLNMDDSMEIDSDSAKES